MAPVQFVPAGAMPGSPRSAGVVASAPHPASGPPAAMMSPMGMVAAPGMPPGAVMAQPGAQWVPFVQQVRCEG